jgi:uncharacterized membrane protein
MKKKMRFAFVFVLAVMVYGTAGSAFAAEVVIQNTLDNDIGVAVLYFDRATRLWTTKGWWNVSGDDDRTLTINNVDESKGMYYHASAGKTAYVDRKALEDPTNRWVSGKAFTYEGTSKTKPKGENVHSALFYKCRYSEGAGAFIVRIDTRPVG